MENKVLIYNNDILQTDSNITEPLEYAILTFLAVWGLSNQGILIKVELNSQNTLVIEENGVAGTFHIGENQFILAINGEFRGQLEELFLTLAHEIVHVKQYVCGELENYILFEDDEIVGVENIWKGKDVTDLPYEKKPYEIEAYKYQQLMTNHLINELNMFVS